MKTTAHDFSKPLQSSPEYYFGLTAKSVCDGLRKLAQELEDNQEAILPQKIDITSSSSREDFTLTTVTITLAEPQRGGKYS